MEEHLKVLKIAKLTSNQSEEGPKLTKSQRGLHALKLPAKIMFLVLRFLLPPAAAAPTIAEVISGRGTLRPQRNLSTSDLLQRARPTSKRQLSDVSSSSAGAFPNLIKVVRKKPVHSKISGFERVALEAYINRVFVNDDVLVDFEES